MNTKNKTQNIIVQQLRPNISYIANKYFQIKFYLVIIKN